MISSKTSAPPPATPHQRRPPLFSVTMLLMLVFPSGPACAWIQPRTGTSPSSAWCRVVVQQHRLVSQQTATSSSPRQSSLYLSAASESAPDGAEEMGSFEEEEGLAGEIPRVASSSSTPPAPTTFREAEVWGLKCMQEGDYEQALKAFQLGLSLPGSRPDVRRTKKIANSPVGGAVGGMDSENVQTLDEFELQAAYYNMACAHAQLGNLDDSVQALQQSFENGFDNYATVRGDPDLDSIKKEKSFERLMETYEPKKGFNPFGFLGKS